MNETMTRNEVAAVFRVHPRTVTRWVQQGRLRACHINRRFVRFEKAEVERLLRDGADSAVK